MLVLVLVLDVARTGRRVAVPKFTNGDPPSLPAHARPKVAQCLWPDPKDDLLLELALAGNAPFIITHNTRDFQGVEALGIRAVTPDEFHTILSQL